MATVDQPQWIYSRGARCYVYQGAEPPPNGALYVREVQPPQLDAYRAQDRKGGTYLRYYPADLEMNMTGFADGATLEKVADTAAVVAKIGQQLRDKPMPIMYATLIRNEAISSSWVEGLHETPRNIMIARLKYRDPSLSGVQFMGLDTANAILANIESMQSGVEMLHKKWTLKTLNRIHEMLGSHSKLGLRKGSVQIGGQSKLNAAYVAPPADRVSGLLQNLMAYANSSGDNPIIKAAIIHAQFENIHPYEDGNGRTGRILVHGYLSRSALVDHGVLPLSIVLRNDVQSYVNALASYRHDRPETRQQAVSLFIRYFCNTLIAASEQAESIIRQTNALEFDWHQRTSLYRSHSTIHKALPILARQPVVTARYLAEELNVSAVTAHNVVQSLVDTGILEPSGGRFKRSEVYQAPSILRMMDLLVPGIQPTRAT